MDHVLCAFLAAFVGISAYSTDPNRVFLAMVVLWCVFVVAVLALGLWIIFRKGL